MTALKGAVDFFPEIGGTHHTKGDISARHLIGSNKICRRIPPARAQASATLPQEIIWRWNYRTPETKIRTRRSISGQKSPEVTTVWKPKPVVEQMRGLLCVAPGRQVRRAARMGSSLAVRLHVKELSGRTCIDTRPCLMPCVSPEQTEYKMNTTSCGATKLRMSVPAWRSSTPIRRRSSARWSAMISSAICDGRR